MVAIIKNGKQRELSDADVVRQDRRGQLYVESRSRRDVLAPAWVKEGDDMRPGAINYVANR